jgi:hypothetical protein
MKLLEKTWSILPSTGRDWTTDRDYEYVLKSISNSHEDRRCISFVVMPTGSSTTRFYVEIIFHGPTKNIRSYLIMSSLDIVQEGRCSCAHKIYVEL